MYRYSRYRLAWRWRGTEELGTTFLCGGKLDLAKFFEFSNSVPKKFPKFGQIAKLTKFRKIQKFMKSYLELGTYE